MHCDNKTKAFIDEFVSLILHGDEEHKDWLQEAGEQYCENGTVPPPRGKGVKDKYVNLE